jgi:phosphoenolpyruvate synthase/pyruvate phosphate dikinase
MDIQKEILENEWYGQGLNAVPLIFESATVSTFSMKNTLGYGYHKFYCSYKEKFGYGNYWKEDLERLSKILLKKLEKPEYMQWLIDQYFKEFNEAAKIHQEVVNLSDKSDETLIELAQKTNLCIREGVGIAHIIEPFSLIAEKIVKDKLESELKDKSKLNELFPLLTAPAEKPFILEYDELLNKLRKTTEPNKRDDLVKEIQEKFFWIKNGYAGRKEFTCKDIIAESNELQDLKNFQSDKKKLIEELNLSPELRKLIGLTEKFAYWQDVRKKNTLVAIDYFCKVSEELIERIPLTAEEYYFLLPEELDKEHLTEEFRVELEKRSKNFVLVNVEEKVYSTTKKLVLEKKEKEVKTVNGTPASPGDAIGRVKICTNFTEMNKVEQGDVLVVSMTRPEYVPAMRKAVAIVTDEGGLTCHAAVIARELGKPCIIGTRIATKVFKDNDLVEVRANHSLIKIIERKK